MKNASASGGLRPPYRALPLDPAGGLPSPQIPCIRPPQILSRGCAMQPRGTNMLREFGDDWTSSFRDMLAEIQTGERQNAHYDTPPPYWGRGN